MRKHITAIRQSIAKRTVAIRARLARIFRTKKSVEQAQKSKTAIVIRITLHLLLLLSSGLALAWLAVFVAPVPEHLTTPLSMFYSGVLQFLFSYNQWVLLGAGAFVVTLTAGVWIMTSQQKKAVQRFVVAPLLGVLSLALSIAVGSLLAAAITLGVMYFDLQTTANFSKTAPEKLGVVTDLEEISSRLADFKKAPKLVFAKSEQDTTDILFAVVESHQKRGPLYFWLIEQVYPSKHVPQFVLPTKSVVLIENMLLIQKLDEVALLEISPGWGKALVAGYFKEKNIRENPDLTIISRQDYLKYRDDQIDEQLAEIDDEIAVLAGRIRSAKNKVDATIISYYYGNMSFNAAVSEVQRLDNLVASLQREQAVLRQVKEYVALQKDIAPYELGLFVPEREIKVVLEHTSDDALSDYLAILVHEYLHFSSYVSDDDNRQLSQFFEEGLTEYYTRKITSESLGLETEVGYPIVTRVIQALAQKLPAAELEEAYFTKQEDLLEHILDEAYGENFYEDTSSHFTAILFSPVDDALRLANDILFSIGVDEISRDEIM